MDIPPKLKILIVNRAQYGYHVDPYKYSIYLKKDFEITHLCWDYGLPKIYQEGIEIRYISRKGNAIQRYLRFLTGVHKEIRNHSYDVIFMIYFLGCSVVRLLNQSQAFNVDIRTGSDTDSLNKNRIKDLLLIKECKTFGDISIISENLSKKMGFKNPHILPLGGECFSSENSPKNGLFLLYVGTLENRNMMTFVKGFHQFYVEFLNQKNSKTLHLTIIGDGPGNELDEIMAYIKKHKLQDAISTKGYVQNDLLHHFFENSNVGVSYIPITEYYQNQPPTKTYEYLLSGLAVIATATNENAKIINEQNGVLIQDGTVDVVAGLQILSKRMQCYHPEEIREQMADHLWVKIVHNNLQPYLIKLALAKSLKKPPLP